MQVRLPCWSIVGLICGSCLAVAALPRPGVECGCGSTGNYVSPAIQTVTWNASSSPNGVYQAAASWFQNRLTLTITADGQTVLSLAGYPDSLNWGFSPDDHRLVVHFAGAGSPHQTELYDLENGGANRWTHTMTVMDSATFFSPRGRYLVYAARADASRTELFVKDTASAAAPWRTAFTFAPYPGTAADRFGIAGWGFGPDAQDSTFHFAYVTQDGVSWNPVNLDRQTFLFQNWKIRSPAEWRFSRCGDVLALVELPAGGRARVWLERTLDGTHLVPGSELAGRYQRLYTTAQSHCAQSSDGIYELASNTADVACDPGTPQAPYWPEGSVLAAEQIGPSSLILRWPAASSPGYSLATYELREDAPEARTLAAIPAGEPREWVATGLSPNTEYTFSLHAVNAAELWSDVPLSVTVSTPAPETGPTWPVRAKLTISELTETTVTFHWPAAVDDQAVTSYRVWQEDQLIVTVPGDTLACTVTELSPATYYRFSVEAGDADDHWTATRLTLRITTADLTPPSWPPGSRLFATQVGQTSLTVNWTEAEDNVGVASYRLYVTTQRGARVLTWTSDLEHPLTCLLPGSTVHLKVEAGDDADNWSTDGPSAFPSTLTGPLDCEVVLECASVSSYGEPGAGTHPFSTDPQDLYSTADSERPVLSADGRWLAFVSSAIDLVPEDHNSVWARSFGETGWEVFWSRDVFVRDRRTGRTERVSVSSAGAEGDVEGGCEYVSLSADGRFVAFDSTHRNLVPADTNGKRDIFVHDRQTRVTRRVSVSSQGVQGTDHSVAPSISADGRYVAFVSWAADLVPDDTNGKADVFIHDRTTGETRRVSVSTAGQEGDGDSMQPIITPDGRVVAFYSRASNLVSDDTNGSSDVFVHEVETQETTCVSVSSSGEQGNDDCGGWYGSGYSMSQFRIALSADGRYVAFDSLARNLVPDDTNGKRDIFLHDRETGITERVNLSSAGEEARGGYALDYGSYGCSMSADGRWVAFSSSATNLVAGDTSPRVDVFLRDRETATTTRVSHCLCGEDGTEANGYSEDAVLTPDGRFVAFTSSAGNLVPGLLDWNLSADVFVFDRLNGAGDRDGDGVADTDEQGPLGDDPDYDGNGDGIPDWRQSNVLTIALPNGQASLSFGAQLTIPGGMDLPGQPDCSWSDELGAWDSPLFRPWDIQGLTSFATRLTDQSDGVSVFLWSRFSEMTRQLLTEFSAEPAQVQALLEALVDELNAVIMGELIYDPTRFAGVSLSPPTLTLLDQNPQGDDLVLLNRLLLNDAYPTNLFLERTCPCCYTHTLSAQVWVQFGGFPGDAPSGVTFPYGVFNVSVNQEVEPGGAFVLFWQLPDLNFNSFYKYGPTPDDPTPHWYEFLFDGQTGAMIQPGSTLIPVWFVDGERGDDDLLANGSIADPGGPVWRDGSSAPALFSSPSHLSFAAGVTESSLHLHNAGGAPLVWSVSPDLPEWLSFSPATGSVAEGQTATVVVRVNRDALEPDTYECQVPVFSAGGVRTVRVTVQLPLEIVAAAWQPDGSLEIAWRAGSGRSYRVQGTIDLSQPAWTDLSERIVGSDTVASWREWGAGRASSHFYRIRLAD